MKKVVKVEDFYYNEEEKQQKEPKVKAAIKKALRNLLITGIIMGCAVGGLAIYRNKAEKKMIQEMIEESKVIGRVQIGNKMLEIASPELREGNNGELSWQPPTGFIRDETGLCYRIKTIPNIAETKLDKEYVAPEGMILVDDKAVDVIDPDIEVINGEEVRTCPEGYELVGVIGVKIVDAIEVEPTLGR